MDLNRILITDDIIRDLFEEGFDIEKMTGPTECLDENMKIMQGSCKAHTGNQLTRSALKPVE